MQPADLRWKTWTNLLLGMALTVLFLWMMAPFVVAFLLGAVIAIIASPMNQLLNRKMKPTAAAALTTAGITGLIFLPLGVLLFSGSHRLLRLISDLRASKTPPTLTGLEEMPWVRSLISSLTQYLPVEREWIRDQSLDLLQTLGESLSRIIASSLAGMPSYLLGFFVAIISTFFLLKEGDQFVRFLEGLSPVPPVRARELFQAFEKSCRGVVLSLLASALVQGVLMTVFALVTGMNRVVVLGFLTLVMGMVPIVGAAPVWLGATAYLFLTGSPIKAAVMFVGGILISTSDNVVRPLILREHSQMHPLLALVSVFGAINLVGATGIFLGPIIAAVFVSFLKILAMENQRDRELIASVSGGPP